MPFVIDKIIQIKKYFLPTAYDRYLKKLHENRVQFYSQFINKGDLCFDIGANMGNRTEIFLKLGAKVIAVEPQESCYQYLNNKFVKKATIIKKGIGSKNEMKDFFISNHNQLSTFSKEWIQTLQSDRFKESKWYESKPIEIITLDSIIEKTKIPQFIKIDVEGFELEVFKGLSKPFRFLCFEFAVPDNLINLQLSLEQLHTNYKNLVFNYAEMDNTFLELNQWISYNEIMELINTEEFSLHSAGDIYVKNLS